MRQLTASGSTVISWVELIESLRTMRIPLDLARDAVGAMFENFTLRGFPASEMVALGFHYDAETAILNYIEGAGN